MAISQIPRLLVTDVLYSSTELYLLNYMKSRSGPALVRAIRDPQNVPFRGLRFNWGRQVVGAARSDYEVAAEFVRNSILTDDLHQYVGRF